MFSNHINRSRSGFIVGAITWLMFALPCGVFAQSPLTVQPSTGRVGVGNTNPSEALDVSGTVKATAFKGDGSQLTNLPIGGSADTADVQIFTTPGTHTWTKPLNAKQVFVYLIGGGGGGGSGRRGGGDGGGGGGGGRSSSSWPGALLGPTETITIGAGGTGGPATGTDNTIGNTGVGGESTTFGSWLKAGGDSGGWGGGLSDGIDGDANSQGGSGGGGMENGGIGETNCLFGGGVSAPNGNGLGAGGGGAGGGIGSGNVVVQPKSGGQGGLARGVALNGGLAGVSGATPTAGTPGDSAVLSEAAGGGGGSRASGGAAAAGANGGNYYAILQEGSGGAGPTPPGKSVGPTRYKIGDVIEGFSLSEIRDKNVVFSKGASRVELALDYFRKVEAPPRSPITQAGVSGATPVPGQAAPVSPLVPRVIPQLPRRERLPAPPTS